LSRVRSHIIVNFAGQGWTALLNLLFVPVYIRLLGIEAYGLVGFYAALQSIANVLDLGLSPTINRELARYSTVEGSQGEARDLVRTFEAGYWAIGIGISLALLAASPFIASSWINADQIPVETVQRAVQLMALATGLQWPLTLYQGGLMGLQRPALLQTVTVATVTLRTLGAVVVLLEVSPTITAFFAWQAVAIGVQTLATTLCLWHSMPKAAARPRVDLSLLRTRWRFAAGISATSAVTLMLTQLDKVVLSRLVSLQLFGYYVLAGTVSDALYKVVTPLYVSIFPQFSRLVATRDEQALTTVYHRSCQLLSVLLLPAALVVAMFSVELIAIWTANPEVAAQVGPVVKVLIAGTALNGLMSMPYAAQLAHGWVSLALVVNTVALLVLAPILLVLTSRYGLVGAGAAWALLNAGSLLIEVPIMHRRILRGQWRRWFLSDLMMPLLSAAAVVALGRYLMPAGLSRLPQAAAIGAIAVAGVTVAAMSAAEVRSWFAGQLRQDVTV